MIVALVLLGGSIVVFGWSSLGWWAPSESDEQHDVSSALALYSNDPQAIVSARLEFDRGVDGDAEALVDINFGGTVAAEKFRWALIGTGDFEYNAEMETVSDNAGPPTLGPGQFVQRSLKIAKPSQLGRTCEGNGHPLAEETAIVGGLGNAYLIGTDGVERVEPGEMITVLHFPHLHPTRSSEDYTFNLGSIGTPTSQNNIQLGPLEYQFVPTCVDLGNSAIVGGAGRLTAQKADWKVSISPENPEDTLQLSDPPSTDPGTAQWDFTQLIQPKAVFVDKRLQQLHQFSLFIDGVFAGIGTNYLVQGLTGLTEGSGDDSPGKVRRRRSRRAREQSN